MSRSAAPIDIFEEADSPLLLGPHDARLGAYLVELGGAMVAGDEDAVRALADAPARIWAMTFFAHDERQLKR